MPYSNTVEDWGTLCIAHMRVHPDHHLNWTASGEELAVKATLLCAQCRARFSLRPEALIASDPSTRLVADFLRTDWGKQQLLQSLTERAKYELRPGEHPFDPDTEPTAPENRKTGWSKILDEDPFDD